MGNIVTPGSVPIGVNHIPFPLQNPVGQVLQTPGGLQFLIAGGVDPLTSAAVQIAAGLAPAARWPADEWSEGPTSQQVAQQVAANAVAIAMQVFKACHATQEAMNGPAKSKLATE